MTAKLPIETFARWLASGERGISSQAIVAHITGSSVGRWYGNDHPYDVGDLRRCELLLRQVDLARLMFPTMASRSREWAALVEHWDELIASAESEAPGIFDGGYWRGGGAPRTAARMNEIFAAAKKVPTP